MVESSFNTMKFGGETYHLYQTFHSKERARHRAKMLRSSDPGYYKNRPYRIVPVTFRLLYPWLTPETGKHQVEYLLYHGPRRPK